MITPATAPPVPLATLDAVLERITYANEETGYTVARVATRGGGSDLLTVVGALLGAQPGESLRMQGLWMLQRNLLYTAVTRARRIVVLVGSKRAISKAVRKARSGARTPARSRHARATLVPSAPALGCCAAAQTHVTAIAQRHKVRQSDHLIAGEREVDVLVDPPHGLNGDDDVRLEVAVGIDHETAFPPIMRIDQNVGHGGHPTINHTRFHARMDNLHHGCPPLR